MCKTNAKPNANLEHLYQELHGFIKFRNTLRFPKIGQAFLELRMRFSGLMTCTVHVVSFFSGKQDYRRNKQGICTSDTTNMVKSIGWICLNISTLPFTRVGAPVQKSVRVMTQGTDYAARTNEYVVQQKGIVLWLIGVTNKEKPRKGEGASWRAFLLSLFPIFLYFPPPPPASTSSETPFIEIPRGGPTMEASGLKWMLRLNNGERHDIALQSFCQCVRTGVPWALNSVNIFVSGISWGPVVKLISYRTCGVFAEVKRGT
jgi:hypothetical protein